MYTTKLYFSDRQPHVVATAQARVTALLQANGFDAATFTAAVGVWQGVAEPGFVCELIHADKPAALVAFHAIAAALRDEFEQESVLLTQADGPSTFDLV